MQKIINLLHIIEEDLTNQVVSRLPELEEEIIKIFQEIKTAPSLNQAAMYFDLLQEAQSCIDKLIFKYHMEVSDYLWEFFKECDRLDDPWLRERIYFLIKENKFNLLKRLAE